jgi:hypothetical protein
VKKEVLQIRDVYPGSGSRVKKAPDPGSGSATLEKRRNLGGFLTPLCNLQIHAAFIAALISEE